MATQTALWISTRRMADLLGVHRVTLQRMKSGGYFKAGHHFREANPLSARSNTLWNSQRVLLRIDTREARARPKEEEIRLIAGLVRRRSPAFRGTEPRPGKD